jgi:hypothetical protein
MALESLLVKKMVFQPPEEVKRFHEIQQFHQVWIWVIIAFIAALSWYFFIVQIVFGKPLGSNPAPDWVILVIWVAFGILFPLWFMTIRLEIVVTDTGLVFRFFPLHLKWRTVPFSEIIAAAAVTYRPLREYGGWGIRFGWRGGMAYNVQEDQGVRITLNNGKKILLGSQHAEELESALKSGMTRVHGKEDKDWNETVA